MEPVALVFINVLPANTGNTCAPCKDRHYGRSHRRRIRPIGFHTMGRRWVREIFVFNLLGTITNRKLLPVRGRNVINVAAVE